MATFVILVLIAAALIYASKRVADERLIGVDDEPKKQAEVPEE